MATYLICHGAWSAGWAWKKIRPLLRAAGHEVFTPSYTGLGERAHLAHPLVDLETHICDVVAVIECEDLRDLVLVGHSYGGMVATGVADRVPDRIGHLLYLDAFVPQDGQSVDDLTASRGPAQTLAGWLRPPLPPPGDTAPEDLAWIKPRRHPQPDRCFSQRIALSGRTPPFLRTYIHCTRKDGLDVFAPFADRFRADPAWRFQALDASHSPNVTAPEALNALLLEAASVRSR